MDAFVVVEDVAKMPGGVVKGRYMQVRGGAVSLRLGPAPLWSAKLGQKALTGKVDILSCLTNRRILFAVLGRGETTCRGGNRD